ncbi:hypothetical protein HanIR_Chr07g0300871 [Helianthus annuus]|nr:hypothetical protein HanIR_Chr07g0300871 [Helianthus annuus]
MYRSSSFELLTLYYQYSVWESSNFVCSYRFRNIWDLTWYQSQVQETRNRYQVIIIDQRCK